MAPTVWIPLAVAVIAAAAATVSAILARRSAKESKAAQLEIERQRMIEARVSALKGDIYKPMIDALNDMLLTAKQGTPQAKTSSKTQHDLMQTMHKFAAWLTIVGSDNAVIAFRNFMQAAFNRAPHQVHPSSLFGVPDSCTAGSRRYRHDTHK